jgi:hypothetical protein
MSQSGDFSPITNGDITVEHFQTDHGKSLFNFIATYGSSSNNAARYPSLAILRQRYQHVELPEPDPADEVRALVYEVRLEKLRADIRVMSTDLEALSKMPDPLPELEKAGARLTKLSEPLRRTKHLSLGKVIGDILNEYDQGNILPEGMPWPWPSLTKATRGQHKKEFYVFAGRPKNRKTFVAGEVGVRSFMDQGARVLFFTPEMPPRQIMLRCIASMAKVRYTEFKNGELDKAEIDRLCDLADTFGVLDGEDDEGYSFRLKQNPRFDGRPLPQFDVIQSTGRDVSWIQTQVEIFQPDIIICDSFYRQEGGKSYDSDWKAIAAVSRRLKDLVMEANIIGIGTVQMNRGAEKQVGDLSNLALSDAIGQDADAIFRVITGKIEGEDRSALFVLGGREVPFDGILINNRPCWDFGEIGPITNKKQVRALMAKDDEDDEEEGDKKKGSKKKKPEPQEGSLAAARAAAAKNAGDWGELQDLQRDPDQEEVSG